MPRLWKSTSRPRKLSEIELQRAKWEVERDLEKSKRGLANTSLAKLRGFSAKAFLLVGHCMRVSITPKIGLKIVL